MIVLATTAFAAACTSTPTVAEGQVDPQDLVVRIEIVPPLFWFDAWAEGVAASSGGPTAEQLEQEFMEKFVGEGCTWWPGSGEAGGPVTLLDGSGEIVGEGQIRPLGRYAASTADPFGIACVYRVAVPDVADSDFYKLEISGESVATVAGAQLEADRWTLVVELIDSFDDGP